MVEETENQELEESDYYPKWLGRAVLEDDFPWDKAKPYSVAEFLDKYTLHDSHWIQIKHDIAYDNHAILLIMWDSVWLPDEIAQSTALVQSWPLLLMKLEGVRQISTLGYENIGGIQRGIATAEIENIEHKNVFVIHDHYGGSVEIVFDGATHFLALNSRKELLNI